MVDSCWCEGVWGSSEGGLGVGGCLGAGRCLGGLESVWGVRGSHVRVERQT